MSPKLLNVVVGILGLGAFLFQLSEARAFPSTGWTQDGFIEDVDAGIAQAKQESKDLLFLFTGSDWCPPCKKLEAEVFSLAEFHETATKQFVLIKLDFPQNRELPAEQAKRNEEWSTKFGISGFPTVAILDRDQRPIGFLGYMEGGPQPFLAALMELREKRVRRDAAFAKLPNAKTDDERAQILDEALSQLDEEVINVYYTEERDRIIEIDADNRLQLRGKYAEQQDAEMRKMILADIMSMSQLEKPERAAAFIDEVVSEIPMPNEFKFEVLQIKLGLLQKAQQFAAANELIDQMLAMEGIGEETRERLLVKKVLQLVTSQNPKAASSLIDETLQQPGDHLLLYLTKSQLLANSGDRQGALTLLDQVIPKGRVRPDILVELVATKADLLVSLQQKEEALSTLDNFSEDTQMPVDLRCEALLHQALIMREMGRSRPAMLMENRAIELADTPQLKREMQNVVERLRKKADSK